jgi:1-acyl-sn-glycerol-3-phosphate acyltransferase
MMGVAGWGVVTLLLQPANRRSVAGRAAWLSRTCAMALRVLRVRVEAPPPPARGVLLAPNHVSYLDILVLASLAPTTFVAKAEVARWPIFGWFAARAGTLFLRRQSKRDLLRVGENMPPVLAAGVNLAVFLEGTSTDGRAVHPFRSSLLEPVVRQGHRVLPVALAYRVPEGHDASLEVAWWGTMPLTPHLLNLLGLAEVEVRVDWGEAREPGGDRKALAFALQAEVEERLQRIARLA